MPPIYSPFMCRSRREMTARNELPVRSWTVTKKLNVRCCLYTHTYTQAQKHSSNSHGNADTRRVSVNSDNFISTPSVRIGIICAANRVASTICVYRSLLDLEGLLKCRTARLSSLLIPSTYKF